MADNSEFLEVTSPATLKNLQAVNAELLKTIASVKDVNANMIGIKTPSGSDSAIKKLTADYDAQAVKIAKLQIELEKYTQAQNRTIISNNNVVKSNLSVEASIDRKTKAQQREIAKLDAVQQLYNKVQSKLNTLTAEYKNLAVQKELGLKLTDSETKRYEFLQGKITKYDTTLKAVDATMGKHQRNVGNYASGFNAVSNSINQLTREAPAFANSVQTGFMAISNNLPIFFDAIAQAGKENQKLQAEGKKTSSVFKQVASSIFSAGTLLSVAVTLLTVYGADLVKAFSGSSDAIKKFKDNVVDLESTTTEKATKLKVISQVLNDTKTTQEQYAQALKLATQEGISLNAVEEARKGNLSLINQELENQIDISIKKAKADKLVNLIVENEIEQTKNIRKEKESYNSWYRKALRATSQYNQTASQIESGITKSSLDNIKELERENAQYYDMLKKLGLENLIDIKKNTKAKKEKIALDFLEVESQYKLSQAILERQKAEANDLMNNEDINLENRIKAREDFSKKSIELIDLLYKKESVIIADKASDDLAKNELALKNKELTLKQYSDNVTAITNRLNNELLALENNHDQSMNELREQDLAYYKKIETEKRQFTEKTNALILASEKEKYKKVSENENNSLKTRQSAFEQYLKIARLELDIAKIRELANAKSVEETDLLIQKYAELDRQLNELESPLLKAQKASEDFIRSMASGQLERSLGSINMAALKMFLDFDKHGQSTFDKLLEGADTMREKFAITFQAIGDVAQEVFGKIFELSNQRFQNEQANLQKEKDVAIAFAGDSAAARAEIELQYQARQKKIKEREFKAKKEQAEFNIIIDTAQAVVAALPNIPLSIAIAAIGAVQLALVASQQTPQYEHGTENHIGGAMIINDQKGSNYKELVTTPDGKSRIYEGRNVKVNAPKGTKVKTASETMDYLMFNDNLNSILTGNNISTPIIEVNNNANFDKIGRDIINAIENKAEFSQLISNGDLKTVIRKGNTETEIMNRRINFLGKKV